MQLRWIADGEGAPRGAIDGWCWDSARPATCLRVEVLVDGLVTASTVADQQRPDLRRRGVGDGSHGFSAVIDGRLADGPERLIAIRAERTVIGQVLVGVAAPTPPAEPAADALQASLHEMSAATATLVATHAERPRRLHDELATLAAILRATGAQAADPVARTLAAARAELARRLGPIAPSPIVPEISLVFRPANLDAAIALIRRGSGRHEVVLVTDDPLAALLPSVAARVAVAPSMTSAIEVARGRLAAILDGPPSSMVALDAALAQVPRDPDGLLLGAVATRRAVPSNVVTAIAATGLLLAAPRDVLRAMGSALDDDPARAAIACTDLRRVGLVEPWSAV